MVRPSQGTLSRKRANGRASKTQKRRFPVSLVYYPRSFSSFEGQIQLPASDSWYKRCNPADNPRSIACRSSFRAKDTDRCAAIVKAGTHLFDAWIGETNRAMTGNGFFLKAPLIPLAKHALPWPIQKAVRVCAPIWLDRAKNITPYDNRSGYTLSIHFWKRDAPSNHTGKGLLGERVCVLQETIDSSDEAAITAPVFVGKKMRTKAKPVVRPTVLRSILPIPSPNSSFGGELNEYAPSLRPYQQVVNHGPLADYHKSDSMQLSSPDSLQSGMIDLPSPTASTRLEMRRKLRDRLQLHRGMVLLKRHQAQLPPNPDGSPLKSTNRPVELSEVQKVAIRQKMRTSIRLKMIKKGELPVNPSFDELELYVQRTGDVGPLAEALVQQHWTQLTASQQHQYIAASQVQAVGYLPQSLAYDDNLFEHPHQQAQAKPESHDSPLYTTSISPDPFLSIAQDAEQLLADSFINDLQHGQCWKDQSREGGYHQLLSLSPTTINGLPIIH